MNVWRPSAHLLFGNWLGEIQQAAWPREIVEPLIRSSPRRGVCSAPSARLD
jgi:hypothetical protein